MRVGVDVWWWGLVEWCEGTGIRDIYVLFRRDVWRQGDLAATLLLCPLLTIWRAIVVVVR